MPMKRLLYFLISLFLFINSTLTTYAKPQLKVVKQGGFVDLSTEDKQDTITVLVSEISNDLQITTIPHLYFYSAKDWGVAANYYQGLDYIFVNLSTFENSTDADIANESVEYHLVKIIAHEVRHDFQWEHQFDDSDYGRACLYGYNNYQQYYNGIENYYQQFIELDANEYGKAYADKYFGK